MKETFLGTSCEAGEPGKRKQGLMSGTFTKKVGPVTKIFHPKYPVSLQMETEQEEGRRMKLRIQKDWTDRELGEIRWTTNHYQNKSRRTCAFTNIALIAVDVSTVEK